MQFVIRQVTVVKYRLLTRDHWKKRTLFQTQMLSMTSASEAKNKKTAVKVWGG